MGGFYDREHILSSGAGGPSEDSSFMQFNDRNGPSSFVENEDILQRFASIGTSNNKHQENYPLSVERKNSQTINNQNRAKATIDINGK